jgi:DNA-binding transcriptional regulator YdaS (Cro superfamily)
MNMKEYLNSISQPERESLAERCGTSVNYFWQIAGSHRKPSPSLSKKIELHTGGLVTCRDLRPDIYDDPESGKAA